MPDEHGQTDTTLAQLGAATYETDDEGNFYHPTLALARFLLGPVATIEDLVERRAPDFYVFEPQRTRFLNRMRNNPGVPVRELVRLRFHGGLEEQEAWCRCVSFWDKGNGHFRGLLVRFGQGEEWVSDRALAHTGWAFFQVDGLGRTSYASSLDAELLGHKVPPGLLGQPRHLTHWADPRDAALFRKAVRLHGKHSDIVEFRHSSQRPLWAELYQHLSEESQSKHRMDVTGEGPIMEGIWRDVTEERIAAKARAEALLLEASIGELAEFELRIASKVADLCAARAAAFYRWHSSGQFLLRACAAGVPMVERLPRRVHRLTLPANGAPVVDLPDADGRRSMQPFLDPMIWRSQAGLDDSSDVKEFLIPIVNAESGKASEVYGCIWVPLVAKEALHKRTELRVFAATLAEFADRAEYEAARVAANRIRERAIEALVQSETGSFLHEMLMSACRLTRADAGSLFLVKEIEGGQILEMKTTTGLRNVHRTGQVRYRVGEALTGTMAARKTPVALLDVEELRRREGLAGPLFVETLSSGDPVSWLGCPILDRKGNLAGYVRLVNRGVARKPGSPPGGFSEGDVRLMEAIGEVAGQLLELRKARTEHESILEGSVHEFRAPLVSIRGCIERLESLIHQKLGRAGSDRRFEVHIQNLKVDCDVLRAQLDDLDILRARRAPNRVRTPLYWDIILPLSKNLDELARRQGYRGLRVSAQPIERLHLHVDPSMLRQVFYNLFMNAIKYGPEPSDKIDVEIEIRFEEFNGAVRIFVADFGIGIEDEIKAHVFERYTRAPAAQARAPTGKGLGLYLIREILHAHQGEIGLSERHDATEFVLTLPRT